MSDISKMTFPEKCAAVLNVEASIKALADKASAIAGLKRDLDAEETALRDSILAEMQADGVTNAEECGLVFALQNVAKKVIVTDEAKIPDEYFKTIRTLDKTKLNAACKEGDIAGTSWSNGGQTLAIRAKGRQ